MRHRSASVSAGRAVVEPRHAEMQQDAQVMREKSAISPGPRSTKSSRPSGTKPSKSCRDRDVVVYLGYDLLHLERYDELLALTTKYEDILPKDAALPC